MKNLFNRTLNVASKVWRFIPKKIILRRFADFITNFPVPFGLSYQYGKLYGWTIHEKLHNPEPETVAFFKKHLKAGDRIADIGANIGYYTLLFSQLVGDQGKVVAFEPSPTAFNRLIKATMGKKNVIAINKGAYSHADTLRLYASREGDTMGSVVYIRGKYCNKIQVIPLSSYPETFTFAKIDVEGAEIEVLRGMKTRIKAVLEVARGIQEKYREGIVKFFLDIESLGYSIFFIVENGETILYTGQNIDKLQSNIYIEPKL